MPWRTEPHPARSRRARRHKDHQPTGMTTRCRAARDTAYAFQQIRERSLGCRGLWRRRVDLLTAVPEAGCTRAVAFCIVASPRPKQWFRPVGIGRRRLLEPPRGFVDIMRRQRHFAEAVMSRDAGRRPPLWSVLPEPPWTSPRSTEVIAISILASSLAGSASGCRCRPPGRRRSPSSGDRAEAICRLMDVITGTRERTAR